MKFRPIEPLATAKLSRLCICVIYVEVREFFLGGFPALSALPALPALVLRRCCGNGKPTCGGRRIQPGAHHQSASTYATYVRRHVPAAAAFGGCRQSDVLRRKRFALGVFKKRSSRAKPPRRARRAPGHRTHTPRSQAPPISPETRPTTPRIAHQHTPHTSVNSNPAQRVRRSRDGSRLANPHRQANLRRRGDLHRDGDALHHKRHVLARRPRGLRLVRTRRASACWRAPQPRP